MAKSISQVYSPRKRAMNVLWKLVGKTCLHGHSHKFWMSFCLLFSLLFSLADYTYFFSTLLLTTLTGVQYWINAKSYFFFTEAMKLLISESFEATVAKTSWFALDYFEKHYNNGSMRNWWHWLIEKTKHCFHWICVELNPSKRSKHWSWISV